jgi:ceramide glucosyltransferase
MSALIRKSMLEECGSMQAFADVLAEDYFFGAEFANRGWKSVVAHFPALQNAFKTDICIFIERMCRWTRLRISVLPHMIVLEPAQECFMSGIFGACAMRYLTQNVYFSFVFIGWHILYWAVCDYILISVIQNGPLPFSILQFSICWFCRELLVFPIFIMSVLNPNIKWKTFTYNLAWGGQIKRVY